MTSFPFGDTVILHRLVPAGRDEYGVTVRVDQPVTLERCATWAGPSSERTDNQTQVTVDRTVVLPAGTTVLATDEVTVRGQRYTVVGQPADDRSPFTGWAPGVVVELRKVSG